MPKPFKILTLVISLLLIASLCVAVYVLFGIDPNSYKSPLETAAKEQGIKLTIEGDLGWSLYPELAIVVGKTQFESTKHGIKASTFNKAELVLSWAELLQQKVAIKALKLHEANFHFTQLKQGAAIAALPATAPQPIQITEQKLSVAVDKLDITNSQLRISADDNSKDSYRLSDITISTQNVRLDGTPFTVTASLSYQDSMAKDPISLSVSTELAIDQSQGLYTFKDTSLTINGLFPKPLKLNITGNIDTQNNRLSLSSITGSLESLVLKGNLSVADYQKTQALDGYVDLSVENLRSTLETLTQEPMNTRDSKAFSKLSLTTHLTGTLQNLKLDDLTLTLDTTTLKGQLALTTRGQRNLAMILKGDSINVDSYLAPEQQNMSSNTTQASALLAPIIGPLALLDGGEGHVDLGFKQIVYEGLRLTEPRLVVDVKGKQLTISQLETRLFDGSLNMNGVIDLNGPEPEINIHQQLTHINLQMALAQLADNVDIHGFLSLDFTGKTRGHETDSLIENLTGSGNLTIENLVLASINLEQNYCQLAAQVEKTPQRTEPWPKGTNLHTLESSYHFDQGNLLLDKYSSGTGNLKVRGNGSIALRPQTFNIKVITRLEGDRTSEQGCAVKSKRIRDRDIPLQCKDSFANAGAKSCKPDPEFITKLIQKELIDKIRKKTHLDDASSKALEGLLRGILDRKK